AAKKPFGRRIQQVIAEREIVIVGQFVIQFGQEAVIVVRTEQVVDLSRQTEERLGGVDGVQIVQDHARELVRFGAARSLIVAEEENLVLLERASDRRAEL